MIASRGRVACGNESGKKFSGDRGSERMSAVAAVIDGIEQQVPDDGSSSGKPRFWSLSVAELSDISDRLGVPLPTLVRALRTGC